MCNQSRAIEILDEVYGLCNPIYNNKICDAYLYGSYARGDYTEESDVDILLTVNMTPSEITKYRRDLAFVSSDLSLKHDVTVSITAKPIEQFRQYSSVLPYYKNVIGEGIRYGS